MKVQMINDNALLWQFHAEDILLITADTFGTVKRLSDTQYHECSLEDKGTCIVVCTHNKYTGVVDHIFPKGTIAKFKRTDE